MKSHVLRKAMEFGAAAVAATAITCTAAMLERVFSGGSTLAWLARIAPLAAVVPLVIAGFLAICDRGEAMLCQAAEERHRLEDGQPAAASHTPHELPRCQTPDHAVEPRRRSTNSVVDQSATLPLRAQAHCTPVLAARTRGWVGQ